MGTKILNVVNAIEQTTIPTFNASYIGREEGVTVCDFVINRFNFVFKLPKLYLFIKSVDSIHTHHTFSATLVSCLYLLCRFLRIRKNFIHTVHRNFHSFGRRDQLLYKHFILPFRTALIVGSITTRDSLPPTLKAVRENKVKVIYNGIDLSMVPRLPPQNFVASMSGL